MTDYLSERARQNIATIHPWKPGQPDDIVDLATAENRLMHHELQEYINKNFTLNPSTHLNYSPGTPIGSPRLLAAASRFLNTHFVLPHYSNYQKQQQQQQHDPTTPPPKPITIHPSNLLISTGVSSLTDLLSWAICDSDTDGILVPQPHYPAFAADFHARNRVHILPVSFSGLKSLSDDSSSTPGGQTQMQMLLGDPELNVLALERAYNYYYYHGKREKGGEGEGEEEEEEGGKKTKKKRIRPRAVLITNPHNPLGGCYTRETLEAISRWCMGKGEKGEGLHLISDEVYGMSTFSSSYPSSSSSPFHSLLSLSSSSSSSSSADNGEEEEEEEEKRKRRTHHHVLYGASKDFGLAGLRLGILVSRNEDLHAALATVSRFPWPGYAVQDMWACVLEGLEEEEEDDDYRGLKWFLGENRRRLGDGYGRVLEWAGGEGVRVANMGGIKEEGEGEGVVVAAAGLFVWMDFRGEILDEVGRVGETWKGELEAGQCIKELDVKGPRSEEYMKRMEGLMGAFRQMGVVVGNGIGFRAEEVGWARVSFAVGEERLEMGLERMSRALNSFRALRGF